MKFLHDNFDEILEFVIRAQLIVGKIKYKSEIRDNITLSDIENLSKMFRESQNLWGEELDHYFYISTKHDLRDYRPVNAVSDVEMNADGHCFLLFAYQDGGVISVSGKKLDFQNGAKDASWWHPPRV